MNGRDSKYEAKLQGRITEDLATIKALREALSDLADECVEDSDDNLRLCSRCDTAWHIEEDPIHENGCTVAAAKRLLGQTNAYGFPGPQHGGAK